MLCTETQNLNSESLKINYFENFYNFIYLGCNVNNTNRISEELSMNILKVNKAYFANKTLLASKLLSRSVKLKLHQILIFPVMT